jgi:hypothetical protein
MIVIACIVLAILVFLACFMSLMTIRSIIINTLIDANDRDYPFFLTVTGILWAIVVVMIYRK